MLEVTNMENSFHKLELIPTLGDFKAKITIFVNLRLSLVSN